MSGKEPFKRPVQEPLKHMWNFGDREAPKMRAGEPIKNCLYRGLKDVPKNCFDIGSVEKSKRPVVKK